MKTRTFLRSTKTTSSCCPISRKMRGGFTASWNAFPARERSSRWYEALWTPLTRTFEARQVAGTGVGPPDLAEMEEERGDRPGAFQRLPRWAATIDARRAGTR